MALRARTIAAVLWKDEASARLIALAEEMEARAAALEPVEIKPPED